MKSCLAIGKANIILCKQVHISNLLIKLWVYSAAIVRIKCFLPHRCNRLKIKVPSSWRKIKTTIYSILHFCLLIIIPHINKATSHQLLYENCISYVRSFSNTIIYDGNKDSYIYSSSVHLTKVHSLKGAFYFLCEFEE